MTRISIYWYARGYYDGRRAGVEGRPDNLTDEEEQSYSEGYERGVADFCEYDERKQP